MRRSVPAEKSDIYSVAIGKAAMTNTLSVARQSEAECKMKAATPLPPASERA